jgi:fused signal recognition particle receptor
MELLIVLVIVVAVVVLAAAAVFVARGRKRVVTTDAPSTLERTKADPPVVARQPDPVPALRAPAAPPVVAPPVETLPVTAPPLDAPPVDAPPVHAPPVHAPSAEAAPVEAAPVVEVVRPRFRDRLGKARGALGGYFGGVLGRGTIDQNTWDDLEEALIIADVGPQTTTEVLGELQSRVKKESIKTPEELMEALKTDLKKRLAPGDRTLRFEPGVTNVWLFVGVNGVGKTTTIGKIAKREIDNGRTVLMAAGDTFRAAAADQLEMWAQRSGAGFMRGAEGGDPASVIYDGVKKAAANGAELVLADTAGRLQTKSNLMDELSKIRRVADREPGQVTETLLVLDATTGQNGLSQAEQFRGAADITGIVLTKLDGTAKGGIAFAIQTKLGIPIKLVGLGEQVEDLVPFDPDEYVDALFAE